MKLFGVILMSFFGIIQVKSFISTQLAKSLAKEAELYSAPFQKTTLDRLKYQFSENPARSTDVVLYNKSNKSFKLWANTICNTGSWSINMFPQHLLENHTSIIYTIQSVRPRTGVDCKVSYVAEDESFFELETSNPYLGKNKISEKHSPSLSLVGVNTRGNNNLIRVTIQDA